MPSNATNANGTPTAEALRHAMETLATLGVPPSEYLEVFDVGTAAYLDTVERELLDEMVAGGAATCRFVIGPYGAGKTHLLTLLRERALNRGMVVLFANLIDGMNLDEWDALTRFVLERMQLRVGARTLTGLPAILAHLGPQAANSERLHAMPAPHASFRKAMVMGLDPDGISKSAVFELHRYLEGQRVSATMFRRLGITGVKDPLNKRNAEHVLNTAMMTLYAFGVPGSLLAFDESEMALTGRPRRPSNKLERAANLMRRLIDACPTGRLFGTLVVFAVLPDFLDRSAQAYPALGQRLKTRQTTEVLPWRSPVLRIDDVGTASAPEEFLTAAVEMLVEVARRLGHGTPHALHLALTRAGNAVLQEHAGTGFRRPLMKRLASVALNHVGEA